MQALLAWTSLPFLGERSLRSLLDHARDGRRSLADLWKAPPEDLAAFVRLHPRTLAALARDPDERWDRAAAEADQIRGWGVDVLMECEPEYPEILRGGGRRWPVLFAYGALSLLEEPRVALVSSRNPSAAGLAATDALADALARRDIALVTSTSREAYQAAAIAAKRHAGPSVMVLDRGLGASFPSGPAGLRREPVAAARVWDESFDPDLQLLLSAFPWRAPGHARSGPRRDALIFDLAHVVVAVEVRPGGTMEREIGRALTAGKQVILLEGVGDRSPSTLNPQPSTSRWRGGEAAANEVLRLLPSRPGPDAEAGVDRPRQGWQKEVERFLVRACAGGGTGGTGKAFPERGIFARTAAAWSGPELAPGAPAGWLLADLALSGSHPLSRPGELLERMAPGGRLGALVPAEWLEDESLAGAREGWLARGALRLAARLPEPASAGRAASGPTPAYAAILLERDARKIARPLAFAPAHDRMGRFHLRRYLQEILTVLLSERPGER